MPKETLNKRKKTNIALLCVILLIMLIIGLVTNKVLYLSKYDNKIKASKVEVTKYASKTEPKTEENIIKGYDEVIYKIDYMLETEDKKKIDGRTAIVEATLLDSDMNYASWNNVKEENVKSEITNSGKTLRLTITNVTTNKPYSINTSLNIAGAPNGFNVSPQIKVEEETTPTEEIVKPTLQVVKTKSITGKIINKQLGNVENNVELQLCKIDEGICTDKKITYSKADGSYSFSDLQNGKYQIKIVDEASYALLKEIGEVTIMDESVTLDIEIANQTKFRASIKKYIRKVIVTENNQEKIYDYDKIDKALVAVKNIANANIKVIYEFEIKNETEKEGFVKIIKENIPKELEYDPTYEENKGWEEINGVLYNKTLANEVLKPNETKIVTIALKTKNTSAAKNYLNNVSITGENYYTVKYVIDNEVVKELSVIDSGKVDDYKYKKEGYILEGWYTDKDYNNKYDFNNIVEDDLVLYGKLKEEEKENVCSITYVDKGHEIENSKKVECGEEIVLSEICEKDENCKREEYEFECFRDIENPDVCLAPNLELTKEMTVTTSYIKLPVPEINHSPVDWTKKDVMVSINLPVNAKKIRNISKKKVDETGLITYDEEEINTEEELILSDDKYDIKYQIVSEKEYTDETKKFETYTLSNEWNSYQESFIQDKNAIVVGKIVLKNTNESTKNIEHEITNIDKKAPNMISKNEPKTTSILLTGTVEDNQSLPSKAEVYYIEGSNIDINEFLNDDSKKDLVNISTYEFINKTLSKQDYNIVLNNLMENTTYTVGIVSYDIAGNKTDMDIKEITTKENIIVAQIIGRNGTLYESEDDYESFPSLEEARESCGDTIDVCTIQMVLSTSESVEIGKNQNITLDLNGKIVSGVLGSYTIRNNGKFRVIDNVEGMGRIENLTEEGIALDNIGTGIITLGVDENPQDVSIAKPNIVGVKYGIQNSETSLFNFYDGRVEGNVAIYGNVDDTPYMYNANIELKENQVATLTVLAEPEARINKTKYYSKISDAVKNSKNGTYKKEELITKDIMQTVQPLNDKYYFEYNKENQTLSNNNNSYDDWNTQANSYICIDLTKYTENIILKVNASIEASDSTAYAAITESPDIPSYYDERFIDVVGYNYIDSNDYNTTLEPGKIYYLHLGIENGYYGGGLFKINSIDLMTESGEILDDDYTYISEIPELNSEIDTVEMLKNITLTEPLEIEETRNVILDLNGQNLTKMSTPGYDESISYTVINNGNLKVIDRESENNRSDGSISNLNLSHDEYVIYNTKDANLVIDSGNIDINKSGSNDYYGINYQSGILNEGMLQINEKANINANEEYNLAIINKGDMRINGLINVINSSSIGVQNDSSYNIELDGALIKGLGTSIENINGVISIKNSDINSIKNRASLTINSGTIIKNSIDNQDTLIINGGKVTGDSIGIDNIRGTLTINGGEVTGNSTGISNRGILVINNGEVIGKIENKNETSDNNSIFTINGGKITSDSIGIDNAGGTLTINDGIIVSDDVGIVNAKNGIINIGKKDGNVNTETPKILSNKSAVNNNLGGIINYYDGVLTGIKNNSINGYINDLEENYDFNVKEENGNLENITLSLSQEVAQIDDIMYPTLRSAISTLQDNEEKTIKLLKDTKTIFKDNISENKQFILDLNDKNIINYNVSLTNNGNIKIIGEGSLKNNYGDTIENFGTFTIESGVIGSINNSGTLTLGIKDNVVDIDNPVITGDIYGINNSDNAKFNFYDGRIKGKYAISLLKEVEVEDDYTITGMQEDEMEVRYLEKVPIARILDINGNIRENQCSNESNDDGCYNLQDAINSSNDGETVQIMKDGTYTSAIEIVGKKITLDINGKVLSSFSLTNRGTLTIKDDAKVKGSVDTIYNNSNLKIENAKIKKIDNLGKLTIDGGISTINEISNIDTITINDGEIKSNLIKNDGRNNNAYTANIIINGGTINADMISNSPKGINNNVVITINNGTINANKIENGSIYTNYEGTSEMKINNGKINVDGIVNYSGKLQIDDGSIAIGYISLDAAISTKGTIIVNGGNITSTKIDGYAINVSNGLMKINNGQITSVGNAISNSSKLDITGGTLTSGSGHVITSFSNNTNIIGGEIKTLSDNNAAVSGLVNIGVKDGNVNTESPRIISNGYAISRYINGIGSNCIGGGHVEYHINYYDGVLIGKRDKTLGSDISDSEDGYDLNLNEDNDKEKITLVESAKVAEIDDVEYPTLQDAINSLPDGEEKTIKLLKDMSTILSNNVLENKKFILDLNGKNIKYYNIPLTNNGNIKIIGEGSLNHDYGNIIDNSGTLTIEGGTINGGNREKVICNGRDEINDIGINNGGILIINGGLISGYTGIYNAYGKTLNVNGGTISGNTAIDNYSGTVTIENGEIIGKNIGINNSGTINIGVQDGIVTADNPIISGENTGIFNSTGYDSIVNFYDGAIIGSLSKSIFGNVLCEKGYKIRSIKEDNGIEKSILEREGLTAKVAILNGVNYPDLQSAINATTDNVESIITLYTDIALTSNIIVPENKIIKLNLNGFKIDYNDYTISGGGSFIVGGGINETGLTATILNVFKKNSENGKNIIIYEMDDGSNLSILNTYELQVYNDDKYEKLNVENEINNVGRYSIINKENDIKMTTINGKLFLNNLPEGNYKIVDNNKKELTFTISSDGTLSGNIKENYTSNLNRIMSTAQAELTVSLQTGQKVIKYAVLIGIISTILGVLILLRRQIIFKKSLK